MSKLRVVLAGGPGAGKTTLLHALQARGYAIVSETAREIIEARLSQGLSPRPSPLQFAHEIRRQDIEKYHHPGNGPGPVFYDRSVIEALGMVDEVEPFEEHALGALLSDYPYYRQVFVLPPWESIYANDRARDQSFAEAKRIHDSITRWYLRCGYELVEVPKMIVADRCEYVLRRLAGRDA